MSSDISPIRQAPLQAAASPNVRPAEAAGPQAAETPTPAAEAKPDIREARRSLQETTDQLNQQMRLNKRDLNFSVDEVVNKVVVTVKNQEGEVVRQIPSEVALRVAHNIENMKGLMQDEKS